MHVVVDSACIVFFEVTVLRFPFSLATIEFFVVEIRHEICFYVIYHFVQRSHETVEIFLVQENFMAFVAISVFPASALRDRDEVVVSFGFFDIQEIRAAFPGSYALGKYAFFLLAVARLVITATKAATEAATPVIAATEAATPVIAATVTVAETIVAIPKAATVALVSATVAVAITKVVVSPFKMPEFHLSNCFMKKNL